MGSGRRSPEAVKAAETIAAEYEAAGRPYGNTPEGFARFARERAEATNADQVGALRRRVAAVQSDPRIKQGS